MIIRFSQPLFDPQGSPTPAPAPAPAGQAADPAPAANPVNPTPTPDANPAPAQPSADALRVQQLEQQLAGELGSRTLAGAAVSAGLKTPEDIAKAKADIAMVAQMRSAGYDPQNILSLLGGKAPDEPQGPQPVTQESLQESVRTALIGVQSEQQNEASWTAAETSLETKIAELSQDNPAAKSFIESRLTSVVQGLVGVYPQGHPLAGKNSAPTEAQIQQATEVVKAEFAAVLGGVTATNPAVNPAAAILNGGVPAMPGGGLQSANGGNGVAGAGQSRFDQLPKDQRDAVAKQYLAQYAAQNAGALGALASQGT